MKLIESISQWNSTSVTRLTVVTEHGEGKIQVDLLESHEEYGKTAFIWDLYIHPEHRRKGLAKELLNYAIRRAKDYGMSTATLEWVDTDTPRGIWYWYCQLGFHETEFGDGYSLMVKEL